MRPGRDMGIGMPGVRRRCFFTVCMNAVRLARFCREMAPGILAAHVAKMRRAFACLPTVDRAASSILRDTPAISPADRCSSPNRHLTECHPVVGSRCFHRSSCGVVQVSHVRLVLTSREAMYFSWCVLAVARWLALCSWSLLAPLLVGAASVVYTRTFPQLSPVASLRLRSLAWSRWGDSSTLVAGQATPPSNPHTGRGWCGV